VLGILIERGWKDRIGLESDPDFDTIRSDKRFADVIDELEARKAEPG
jgi:hypothetical protein